MGLAGLAAMLGGGAAAAQEPPPSELFQTICVANGARVEAVQAAARAAGFVPAPIPPSSDKAFTELAAMARDTPTGRRAIVVSVGKTTASDKLPIQVSARSCGVTAPSSDWDPRSFARQWVGVAPGVDSPQTALYAYLERPEGNVDYDPADLPVLVAALNAGQVRALVAAERGDNRVLSWVVLEAPDPPAVAPGAKAPALSHDTDPFAPCVWKPIADGAMTRLACPGDDRTPAVRDLTEYTPAKAQGGDPASMLRMASFYLAGPKAARDPAAGLAWSHRAAEAGAVEGVFNIALAYDLGVGGPADKAQAAAWYRKAADLGYPEAMINLAALQLEGAGGPKDEAAAAGWVRRAADAGSADAMFDMGRLHEAGLGAPQDFAQAMDWYRRAADHKDTDAMYSLGVIYADGIGAPQDDAEAARWLVASATPVQKVAAIINRMAFIIDDGRMRKDYLAKAAAGDGDAAMRLGVFFSDREGGGYNPREAVRLLRIAADKGRPLAMLTLGLMYANGDGAPKDDKEAIRWLRAGAAAQNPPGFRRIRDFAEAPLPRPAD